MSENTDNLKKEISEEEEIENLASTLRKNGLAGTLADSVALAKKIIESQRMMYGYIRSRKSAAPDLEDENKKFVKPEYNIAEEEGKTLKDLMGETGESSHEGISSTPSKPEQPKPAETKPAEPKAESEAEKKNADKKAPEKLGEAPSEKPQ